VLESFMEIFIIPLIALAVWVLQYLFRGPEENKPASRSRQASTGRPASRPPRRQVTDLDRYLEETRRRRQQEENKPVVVAELVPEPAARPRPVERRRPLVPPKVPPPRPVVPPPPERPPLRDQAPPPVPVTTRRPSPPPQEAKPVLVEAVPVVVPVTDKPRDVTQSLRMEAPPPEMDTRSRATKRADASALLNDLARIIRTPHGMATGVVLREIFGEPLCRRGRRR
jgi:hypothetical protein